MTTSSSWGGNGLSQNDLMEKDTVLVLDNDDNIIGSASKKESHVFSPKQPYGILHRAFSVFLFDASDGRLLLQQRASHKITFPNVWTNTCCSHELHGMTPSEVDSPQDVANGTVLGAKHAALRKLQHELGIPASQIDVTTMKFLTRLHYWAADTVTHGPESPWGEHEIDYVLFMTVPHKDDLTLNVNPDEIDNVKWVSAEELQNMLNDEQNLYLFSPWFRLICQKWLHAKCWWKDLHETMTTDKHCDYVTIHEFDPPTEHLGGAGKAGPLFLKGDTSKKQGAYGKIKTHKESKLAQLMHVDEVFAVITLLYLQPLESNNLKTDYIRQRFNADDLAFCNDILVKVSRSFASVIRQLPSILLVDILVFYLVLRALDTIEDDTTAFDSNETKVQHLLTFHKNALQQQQSSSSSSKESSSSSWSMDGVGAGDERRLLQQFSAVQRIYAALHPQSRRIIADITQRMATGMAEFVGKDLGQGTTDVDQYNRYCHFVAGLVGEGLSRLFAASGLEKASFAGELHLSDQMGLFLQKTNIIRDYLEDYVDKRAFWPQTIWKKYSATGELGYFTNQSDPIVRAKALECLNELVTDALELVPDCLQYMAKLQCVEIFRFCAIPQVMAIATLDKCYANSDVFTGVVKIRKGLSCKLLLRTNNLEEVHDTFYAFAQSILDKANAERSQGVADPNYSRTVRACETICDLTASARALQRRNQLTRWMACAFLLLPVALWEYWPATAAATKSNYWPEFLVKSGLVLASALVYTYGPWSVNTNLKKAELLSKKTA